MAELPRIRWRDILCTSWLTTSLSSDPVCLASAAPRRLSWLTAWWCMPPSVSRAIGRKTIPCCLLLCPAFCDHTRYRELRLGVQWRRQGWNWRGDWSVTSNAASFPSLHLLMNTSPGLATVPGSRCLSSLTGAREAFVAASKIRSLRRSCLAIRSLLRAQASA